MNKRNGAGHNNGVPKFPLKGGSRMDELNELDVGPAPGGEMSESMRAALLKAYDEDEVNAIMAMDGRFKKNDEPEASDEEMNAAISSLMRNGS
jgi:hypothetical protein